MSGDGPVPANTRGFSRDLVAAELSDKAAPLAFYAALCVLPALVVVGALAGLAGSYPETSNAVLDVVRDMRDTRDAGAFEGPVEAIVRDKQLATVLLLAGLAATAGATALYLRAFRRVSRPLTGHQDTPPPGWGPLPVLARVAVAELIVLAGLGVVVSGTLAHAIGDVAGISEDAVVSWDIVKWPLMLVMAFAGFMWLQRSAFSDPRVLAASAVTSSQVAAALAWAFAITGFALFLASFDTFESTYGTIGSALVLLVWVTMFTMLYYVTPDFRLSGAASLGAGAAISGVAWLGGCVVLAACVAALAPLDGVLAMAGLAIAFLAALWLTNVAVLAGVRLNAPGTPWAGTDGRAVHAGRLEPVSAAAWQEDLVRAVALALQNDDAHDGMLSPFAYAEEETARMSDLELDLADWAFTYGAAWATAKAQNPYAHDAEIAARALAAAREVFRLYCGQPDWEQRIRRQIRRRRPHGLVIEQVDEALGNGHGYGLLR